MTTTTAPCTNSFPDVAPPADAEADIWEGSPPERCVFAVPRCVLNRTGDPLRSPVVVAEATQRADGSIATTAVSVESPGDPGLTSAQARELATLILEAADQVDGWVG